MYLARISISNFRGIKKAEVKLSQHTILLGNNNSGKSSIIDAIGLLLGKEAVVRGIGDYDFFGGDPNPDDRISIKGILTGFKFQDETRHPEWFNDNNGGIPKWYDATTGQLHNEQNAQNSLLLAVEIAFSARFDKDELEFETKRYFYLSNVDPFDDPNINSLNRTLTRKIGFFLIPSKRNWERIISFGSEIFRKVITFQDAIPSQSVFLTRNDLRQNANGIEKEDPFKEIVQRINSEIKGFTGKTADLRFLPTNTDIESVLHSLTPYLLGRGNTNLPLGSHGSGIVSLQTLLLLLEFGRYRQATEENFILAAEEPELHLHPGMHRRLIGRIRNLSTQTIISTHSPEVAAYYKPQEIKIVQTADDGECKILPLIRSNVPPENALMKLFTVYRRETSEALMHAKILIPEGITEYYWLNKLVSAVVTTEGWDITDTVESFGVIPTQDSHILGSYNILFQLSENLIPFVDGDAAGDGYIQSLVRHPSPPKFILQLPAGRMLEHLIAWIILPQNVGQVNSLQGKLGVAIDYRDINQLANHLTTIKTYWRSHDDLIELIIATDDYVLKVRKIIKAFDVVKSNNEAEYANFWDEIQVPAGATPKILRLNLFA